MLYQLLIKDEKVEHHIKKIKHLLD